MSQVVVAEPSIHRTDEHTVVSVDVTVPGSPPQTVEYVLPPVAVHRQQVIDAMFVVGRLVAMKDGWPLVLPGPVSRRLLDRAEIMQDIMLEWYPWYTKPIPLDFEVADPLDLPADRGAISTFTGGVDSFHTVLENRERLTELLFIHGLDIRLEETDFRMPGSARSSPQRRRPRAAAPPGRDQRPGLDRPLCGLGKEGTRFDPVERCDHARRACRHLSHPRLPPSEHGARGGLGLARPHRPAELDRLSLGRPRQRRHHPAQQDGSDRPVRVRAAIPARLLLLDRGVQLRNLPEVPPHPAGPGSRPGHLDTDRIFAESVPDPAGCWRQFEIPTPGALNFAQQTVRVARSLGRTDVVLALKRAIHRYEAEEVTKQALRLQLHAAQTSGVPRGVSPQAAQAEKAEAATPRVHPRPHRRLAGGHRPSAARARRRAAAAAGTPNRAPRTTALR